MGVELIVKFYKDMLGIDMPLGASFNDNQQMARTGERPAQASARAARRFPARQPCRR
jgi:hypothetical protein